MSSADLPNMAAEVASEPEMPELDVADLLVLTDSSAASSPVATPAAPGAVWAASRVSNRDNLLVFDWDDTLLSTAAINRGAWTEVQLQTLLRTVEAVLRVAMSLGETLIVTNGNATWVQDSARAYLPDLLPMLDDIKVISARAQYEEEHPGDPFAWKRRAFRDLTAQWCRPGAESFLPGFAEDESNVLNMVVLGDSVYEMEAAESVKPTLLVGSVIKCVKFVETPSIDVLIGQLRRVQCELPLIVAGGRSQSVNLLRSMRHMAAESSAWTIVDQEEYHKRNSGEWVPDKDEVVEDKQVVSSGLLSWVHQLGDQLLCSEPTYLGQSEESYDEGVALKEQADFHSCVQSATPFASPWQH